MSAKHIEVQTGTRYRVDVDGDGTLRVRFEAVLEAIEFDHTGNFTGLRFDNGLHLWTFNAEGGFTLEAVD